jgi:protein involved in polysaccharide export with SLBB domain
MPVWGQEGASQNPAVDCSDPAQTNSPECANPSPRSGAAQYGVGRPQHRTGGIGTYNDTEPSGRETNSSLNPVPLPPERLTEFQKFVASSTGEVLPIFGANLFRRAPSTFAPVDLAPVPPDFVLGPGDELRIRVWGQVNFQSNLRVDRSGEIYIPQVGPIHVANLPFSALEGQLRSAVGRVYHNFDLTVDLGQIRSIQVYLAGEARQPGLYTVSSLSTLVDALFTAGGPTAQGSLRNVQLRRAGQTVAQFDLYSLILRGDKSKDVKLFSGDVILVPPVGPQVAVVGSVKVPAIYELVPGESAAQLLADAGGVSSVASDARISIERTENRKLRHAMEIPYDEVGLNTPLADGDVLRLYSIVPQYSDTVTLRGNLANPGRFAWHPGMRISDLIPDKESLVTRGYWWKRMQLGLAAPEFEPTGGLQELRQPEDENSIILKPPSHEEDAQDQTGSQQNRNPPAQERSGNSSLGAQQSSAPLRGPLPPQKTTVRLLAPDIDWDYAVVERINPDTLKTILIPFDLGKLVQQHDGSQNIELKSGDIVSIFSEADIHVPLAEQTKLVTLDGEFVHAGVYTVQPDETLQELVARAGGITRKGYLYGSEFTRESVRVAQQARIDEYVQALEMRIQRSNLALAASSAATPQDLASGAAAQSSERDLVSALHQIRATGRIVLTLKPDSIGTSGLPEMTMENGDRFVVPPIPSVVTVVGAVYNQNSFLYVRGRSAGAYLLQAGGPNKDADRRHEFIIRANGDVVSRDGGNSSLWQNKFANLRLNPGDTVVVPEKTFKPSALRGVLDWSQVFSQFALGAAAINVIK